MKYIILETEYSSYEGTKVRRVNDDTFEEVILRQKNIDYDRLERLIDNLKVSISKRS